MDLGVETALNSGAPVPATSAAPAAASPKAAGRVGRTAAIGSASFQDELQAAAHAGTRACDGNGASGRKAPVNDGTAVQEPAEKDVTPGCRGKKGAAPAAEDIASLLLQLLQKVEPAATPPVSAADTPAASEEGATDEDRASEMLARVIALLKQLASSPNNGSPQDNPDLARLTELLGQLDALTRDARPADLAGSVHQLLADLHERLAGVAWGKAVKETIAGGLPAAPDLEETGSSPTDAASAGMAPKQPTQNRPDVGASVVPDSTQTPVLPGRELKDHPAQPRIVFPVESSTGTENPLNAEAARPETSPSSAGSGTVAVRAENLHGARLPETPRPSALPTDTTAPAVGFSEDQNADMSGSRSSTHERPLQKDVAREGVATGPKASADDSPEAATPADPRLTRLHETGPERTAEAVAAGKEKEPAAAGSARTGLFDQIVQRAVVQVRNDQSEIKIDLKPDFLGNVRMQIMTENQQVSVRILTEHPAVRDMLEAGLQQLKSELQNAGLHVDRLEVSVSDDPYRQSRRQARQDGTPKTNSIEGVASAGQKVTLKRLENIYYHPRSAGYATIDMFA
jgi:flagellar hook-length control protein FliK